MKEQAWNLVQTLLETMNELGAEVKEDRTHLSVSLPKSQDRIILSKQLFSIRYASFQLNASGLKDDCPYYSVDLVFNNWTYVGLQFCNITDDDYLKFVDHVAFFIDRMKKHIFQKCMPGKLEELITTYHEIYMKYNSYRTREMYLLWKQTKGLVQSEYARWVKEKKVKNHNNGRVYRRLLNLKASLPHALKFASEYGITVKKRNVSEDSAASKYHVYCSLLDERNNAISEYTNNPYETTRLLIKKNNLA
ncbi:hypothetical protein [Alkalihalobacillus sp. BA299]|uniref:hypothetical protein n=1 Tax=Alkalihalobacillus sp. BA299 TaxID=2815938 RepID=UPI001ADD4914|nr:hypothetical protein [Alkalihalobacillus sp. BA299]